MKDEVQRHHYHPSTLHMGDCSICGNVYDAPLHIGSPSEHRHSHSVGRTPTPLADSSEAGRGRDAYVGVLASLAAAISLLERTPRAKKAAASDKMFDQMIADYRKALEIGRAALSAPVGEPGQSFVLRPISTAPRDGTPFIAIATTKGWRATKIARFLHAEDRLPIPDGGGMWPSPPTHWTQLPVVTLIPESDESPSCADSGDLIAPPAKIPGSSDNHPPAPAVGAEDVARLLEEARDMLMERIYGNPARSPGHNARLKIEKAISLLSGQGGGK